MIGQIIVDNLDRKTEIVKGTLNRKRDDHELHIASVRVGTVTGEHDVGFDSEADSIELRHVAKNRKGFATGALMAAKWLKERKGFFNIDDFMKDMIKIGGN